MAQRKEGKNIQNILSNRMDKVPLLFMRLQPMWGGGGGRANSGLPVGETRTELFIPAL